MRAVVTGGGGFLGRRIVELLCTRGDDVRVVDRQRHPSIEPLGARVVAADVRDAAALRAAFEHADVVYHGAGRVGFWGPRDAFWSINVEGTRAVLDAARRCGVPRLVYTSTPSVVGYARDVENGGPELPYAAVHENAYGQSKCAAERLVLAANGTGIATVALRPHVIIGPGDKRVLPGVVRRAIRGQLRVIGDGRNKIDLTYVDNAAWAHLDAADALTDSRAPSAGRPYFITNDQPVFLWKWLNELLGELDLPPVTRSLSFPTARLVGLLTEMIWTGLGVTRDPPITRALASVLARSHWYDIEPARRDLGYRVRVPMEEATRRTACWLAEQCWADARRGRRGAAPRVTHAKERPEYYITPTHDFTQYTKDYEEKYWSQDTAFDWQQSVSENLKAHLGRVSPDEFARVARLALPLVDEALGRRIREIRQFGLPLAEDALKAIRECTLSDRSTMDRVLAIQEPLEQLQSAAARVRDRLAVLKRERLELQGLQRLGLVKNATQVQRRATEAEGREQAAQLSSLTDQIDRMERALKQAQARGDASRERVEASIRAELDAIEPLVLADLNEARRVVRGGLRAGVPPQDAPSALLRDLVWKRQLRALKDVANHALVVEQSAIAPLTMGIIHYKRRREIQQAMTTFVNDEAKHSAVFRRFLAEKLDAKERIPGAIINGGERYMWLARFLPSGGIFLAVIVEAIGAAYLEFFGEEAHMPDPLFRSICGTISGRDEKRHMDLCVATYNELYRTGSRWEQLRNDVALQAMMTSAYGDKNEDHGLLQACRAFGVESDRLYQHVAGRLSAQLARIGMDVPPERLLDLMRVHRRQRPDA